MAATASPRTSSPDSPLVASPQVVYRRQEVYVAALNKPMPVGGPCDYCGKSGAKKWCGGCGKALYCDAECQKKHFKTHYAQVHK